MAVLVNAKKQMNIKRAEADDIWKMVAIEVASAEALRPLSLFSQLPSQKERMQRPCARSL